MKEFVNVIMSTASVGMDISKEWIGTLMLSGLHDYYHPMLIVSKFLEIKLKQNFYKICSQQVRGQKLWPVRHIQTRVKVKKRKD